MHILPKEAIFAHFWANGKLYGHAFSAHNSVIFGRFFLYSCTQQTKSFRLGTIVTTFGLKLKIPNFRAIFGHGRGTKPIWPRGLKISANVPPVDGVFRPTYISKIIIPNRNQLLSPPPPPLKMGVAGPQSCKGLEFPNFAKLNNPKIYHYLIEIFRVNIY